MTLLTPREAAARLRVAPDTLAKWRCQGRGPIYTKVGGRVLYDEADLIAYITARQCGSTAEADQAGTPARLRRRKA